MTWTRRSCFCATYALVLLFLGVSRAGAWGALAVGVSPDNLQTAAAPAVGKATEDQAQEAALAACRTAKGGADQARSLCTVVGTFRNQCFALAGPGWSIAADEEAARVEAVAKCRSSPCTLKTGPCPPVTVSARCKVISSGCDGEAGSHISAPYVGLAGAKDLRFPETGDVAFVLHIPNNWDDSRVGQNLLLKA